MSGWQQFQALFVFAGGVGLAVLGYLFRARVLELVQDRAPQAAVNAASDRIAALEQRAHAMEIAMQHLPSARDMQALTTAIADLRGELHTVGAGITGIDKAVGTLTRRVELIDEALTRRAR